MPPKMLQMPNIHQHNQTKNMRKLRRIPTMKLTTKQFDKLMKWFKDHNIHLIDAEAYSLYDIGEVDEQYLRDKLTEEGI